MNMSNGRGHWPVGDGNGITLLTPISGSTKVTYGNYFYFTETQKGKYKCSHNVKLLEFQIVSNEW